MYIRARDLYNNRRPDGADNFGLAVGGNITQDFVADQFTSLPGGEYLIRYWWQQATYEQTVVVCSRIGADSVQSDACASAAVAGLFPQDYLSRV